MDWDGARTASHYCLFKGSVHKSAVQPHCRWSIIKGICPFMWCIIITQAKVSGLLWAWGKGAVQRQHWLILFPGPTVQTNCALAWERQIRVSAQVSSKDIALSISWQRGKGGGGCSSPWHCRASAFLQSESHGSKVVGQACFTRIMMNCILLDFISWHSASERQAAGRRYTTGNPAVAEQENKQNLIPTSHTKKNQALEANRIFTYFCNHSFLKQIKR